MALQATEAAETSEDLHLGEEFQEGWLPAEASWEGCRPPQTGHCWVHDSWMQSSGLDYSIWFSRRGCDPGMLPLIEEVSGFATRLSNMHSSPEHLWCEIESLRPNCSDLLDGQVCCRQHSEQKPFVHRQRNCMPYELSQLEGAIAPSQRRCLWQATAVLHWNLPSQSIQPCARSAGHSQIWVDDPCPGPFAHRSLRGDLTTSKERCLRCRSA